MRPQAQQAAPTKDTTLPERLCMNKHCLVLGDFPTQLVDKIRVAASRSRRPKYNWPTLGAFGSCWPLFVTGRQFCFGLSGALQREFKVIT